jgi:hypothetical protein
VAPVAGQALVVAECVQIIVDKQEDFGEAAPPEKCQFASAGITDDESAFAATK